MKIFNDLLEVVRDDKLIFSMTNLYDIVIIAIASMNGNTDVVQEEEFSTSEISQHEEITESWYVRVVFEFI